MQDVLVCENNTGDLATFIRSEEFPCVGAKSALALGRMFTFDAGPMGCPRSDTAIHAAITTFGEQALSDDAGLASLGVVFTPGAMLTEAAFETLLWKRLQALHDLDSVFGLPWSETASSDPASPRFSMSIAGVAYFVIGLHPGASRTARRFSRPAMILNSHDQFERLRADGRYAAMQKIIRERELATEGSVNPMIGDFGGRSEAVQYSGRRVGTDWRCPLRVTHMSGLNIIPPRSGVALRLARGQLLRVIDPEGEQVSDLVAYNADDIEEYISSGRSIDYAGRLFLTTGDILYSSRSRPMLAIERDDVGRHDFTLTPCSADTFRILYGDAHPHHGCQGNLEQALAPHGVGADRIPIAFNVFMHVAVDGASGTIKVLPPLSRAGDETHFRAQMDLVVGLTACSAGQSNNFRYKPIHYRIDG